MAHGAGVWMRIDERVREAHLNHFCPGGASLPVTDSRPIGLDAGRPADPPPALAGVRAAGQRCGRCGQVIAPGQDARRRAGGAGEAAGTWVHESCPR
jgi:hypothetical protein